MCQALVYSASGVEVNKMESICFITVYILVKGGGGKKERKKEKGWKKEKGRKGERAMKENVVIKTRQRIETIM